MIRPEETPIFDGVVAEQGWHPAKLGPPLDIAALVAASYGNLGKPQRPERARGTKPHAPSKSKQRQRRSTRR